MFNPKLLLENDGWTELCTTIVYYLKTMSVKIYSHGVLLENSRWTNSFIWVILIITMWSGHPQSYNYQEHHPQT